MDTQNISSALNKNAQLASTLTRNDKAADKPATSPAVEDDQLTLSPSSPADARQILNQQILASLNKVLGDDGQAKIETLEPSDFSPEKVAERIVSFIQIGIAHLAGENATDGRKAELLSRAIQGVEQGFAEAKEILAGLGALEGKVAEDIDTTHQLIFDGLASLKQSLGLGENPDAEGNPGNLIA